MWQIHDQNNKIITVCAFFLCVFVFSRSLPFLLPEYFSVLIVLHKSLSDNWNESVRVKNRQKNKIWKIKWMARCVLPSFVTNKANAANLLKEDIATPLAESKFRYVAVGKYNRGENIGRKCVHKWCVWKFLWSNIYIISTVINVLIGF